MTAMLAPGDMITLGVGVLAAIVAILAWWASLRAARASEHMAHSAEEANRIHQEEIGRMHKAEEAAERRHREELTLLLAQIEADNARRAEETSRQAQLVSLDLLGDSPLTVGIKNRSISPVFEVAIIDVLDPEEKKSWSWRATEGGDRPVTLEPGAGKLYVLQHMISVEEAMRGHDPNVMGVHPFHRPQIVYGFKDAGGRRWWRLGGGFDWLTAAPVLADESSWDDAKVRIKAQRERTTQVITQPSKKQLFTNLSKGAESDPESDTV